jgi:hypothetical protein
MAVDRAKIERLEKELEEARRELWREDAERCVTEFSRGK